MVTVKLKKKGKGFKMIPNPLYWKLVASGFSGGEFALFLIIYAKTEGWHKDRDRIALSQMLRFSGLDLRTVQRARDSLMRKRVLIKCGNETPRYAACWRLELDPERWRLWGGASSRGKGPYSKVGEKAGSEPSSLEGTTTPYTEESQEKHSLKKGFKDAANLNSRRLNGTEEEHDDSIANRKARY